MKKHVIWIWMVMFAGCITVRQAVVQPIVQPFEDAEFWVLREAMRYEIGNTGKFIEVPKGFVTDFASVPPVLRPIFPRVGRYLVASIVHDYLYWNQSCAKAQADKIFDIAMKESQVSDFERKSFWIAVDQFGLSAWGKNARQKLDGFVKVIPEDILDKIPPRTTWDKYLEQLKKEEIKDGDPDNQDDLKASCGAAGSLTH